MTGAPAPLRGSPRSHTLKRRDKPVKITRTSPLTKKERTIEIAVTTEQLQAWKSGVLIQEAMPNLTPDEREFIKTGITASDWGIIFPPGSRA